MVLIKTKQ